MAKSIEEVNAKVAELQSAIDTKQEAIAAGVAALKQNIADLQAIIDAGGAATGDQLQTVVDNLQSAQDDLESTPTE